MATKRTMNNISTMFLTVGLLTLCCHHVASGQCIEAQELCVDDIIPCTWSHKLPLKPCSDSCGGGYNKHVDTDDWGLFTVYRKYTTYCVRGFIDYQPCNPDPNPVDCQVSSWSAWSTCSATSGAATMERYRSFLAEGSTCGQQCSSITEWSQMSPCSNNCSPVNCGWGSWSAWGACSVTCGNGTRQRSRVKTAEETCGGSCEGTTISTETCSESPITVDCKLTTWTAYSACTVSCGGGTRTRTREVKTPPTPCGAACDINLSETGSCNTGCCPVDCEWGVWEPWGGCQATSGCSGSMRTKERSKQTEASCGGQECTGASTDSDVCGASSTCPVNCEWDAWSDWGPCSKTCGQGTRSRSRSKIVQEQHGGTCNGLKMMQSDCTDGPVPVNCNITKWAEWSLCTQTCRLGLRIRTRQILREPNECGLVCGDTLEAGNCSAIDCVDYSATTSIPTASEAAHPATNVSSVEGMNQGVIIGISVGVCALVVIVVAVAVVLIFRQRRLRSTEDGPPIQADGSGDSDVGYQNLAAFGNSAQANKGAEKVADCVRTDNEYYTEIMEEDKDNPMPKTDLVEQIDDTSESSYADVAETKVA